jgi:multisubunit Na+/H+ antiporter MnhC subunit
MGVPDFEAILYVCAIGLLGIGAVGLVLCRNLFRMVLALVIAEAGVNLLLVLAGYRGGGVAPILGVHTQGTPMVDPVPQALVLTAIVIGVGVQALAVSVLLKVYQAYGTLDVVALRARFEEELSAAAGIAEPGSREAPAGERPLSDPIPAPVSIREAAR